MRVLHVIARLNLGGTARYIAQLATELPKQGIEVFVATGHVQGAEVEDPSVGNLSIIRIPSLGRSINPLKDVAAHRELKQVIAEIKPDIIHCHTFKAGLIARIKKQHVPVVHTFHGHLLDDPEFSGIKSFVITAIERVLAKKSTKLVTVGQRVADDLVKNHIGTSDQYVNSPPGVQPLALPSRAHAFSNLGLTDSGRPTIGWIARVTGVKNPVRALEVSRAIPQAQFLIAGGGDQLDLIKRTAPSNAHVLGWSHAEDLFATCDIVLSTSDNEGMPVALIEAQMAGKPVVATDVGGVSEVIADAETGFVTTKETSALVNALNQLLADSSLRDRMGARAAARAKSKFSIAAMVDAHSALYRSIVK